MCQVSASDTFAQYFDDYDYYVFKLHLSTSLRTNKNLFCHSPPLPPLFTASCFNTQPSIDIYGDFTIQAFEKYRMITLKKATCPEYV